MCSEAMWRHILHFSEVAESGCIILHEHILQPMEWPPFWVTQPTAATATTAIASQSFIVFFMRLIWPAGAGPARLILLIASQ